MLKRHLSIMNVDIKRSLIYSHKPPELPTSLFGWIWPLLKIQDEEMLAKVGLDALLVWNV
jgi:hypothetical protein